MKNVTVILLAFLCFSCIGLEPGVDCYSQNYVDSLGNRIFFLENLIESRETTVIADTYNFEIAGDKMKVEVQKFGEKIEISVLNEFDTVQFFKINSE